MTDSLCSSLRSFLYPSPYLDHIQHCYNLIHTKIQPKALLTQCPTTEQKRQENIRQLRTIVKLQLDEWFDGTKESEELDLWMRVYANQTCWDAGMVGHITSTLHQLFCNTIEALGTRENHSQYFRSSKDILSLHTLGCFALTEMTHGSDTKNMRTAAKYVPEEGHFILHTPDKEAAKIWVGNLGKHATHAIVAAQLYIRDKCYGLHWFVVPLRDQVTHDPLPGVVVGDLGAKTSDTWDGMDNGFVLFDHLKLPREAMLNKYQEVTKEGEYVVKIKDRKMLFGLSLGALSGGRVGIAHDAVSRSRLCLSIAVRYSHARKQFGEPQEQSVISYQYQQFRLMPRLAAFFCMNFFGTDLHNWYHKVKQMTISGDITSEFLSMNSEIHALSCGFKPVASWHARDTAQICRECAGGHGYAAFARLTALREDLDPSLTYEGDNNVIISQVAKYLLQYIKKVSSGKTVHSPFKSVDYLNDVAKLLQTSCNIESSFKSTEEIHNMLKWKSAFLLLRSSKKLSQEMKKAESASGKFDAFNNTQAFHLHDAACAHMDLVVYESALRHIGNCSDSKVRRALVDCMHLFGLWSCVAKDSSCTVLVEGGYMNSKQMELAREEILQWCEQLSKLSLSLVNAVCPPDNILKSAIAPSDLDYPKSIWNWILKEKGVFEKASYWETLRRPVGEECGIKSKM